VEEKEGRQGKYTARGEDKATVEEVERMEEQHSCLRRKTRGFLQQEVARTVVKRRAAERRNRGTPEEEEKGDFPRTGL
jgi:hypothetical protein